MKRVVLYLLVACSFTGVEAMQQLSRQDRQIYQDIIRGTIEPNDDNIDRIRNIGCVVPKVSSRVKVLDGIYRYRIEAVEYMGFFDGAFRTPEGKEYILLWLNYLLASPSQGDQQLGAELAGHFNIRGE